jgi:hypothetical protein
MDSYQEAYYGKLAETAVKSLQNNDFSAAYVKDKVAACDEIMKFIKPGLKVGVGGSSTIRDIGVLPKIEETGAELLDHWKPDISAQDIWNIRIGQLTCDVFLSSSNALTLDGELVNTDGIGNRVCAMTFGPQQVIVVAGVNKLVKDYEAAVKRIRERAAPMRAMSLNLETPCVRLGVCTNCNHPQRICRATVILERRPAMTPIHVVIVGEELGF